MRLLLDVDFLYTNSHRAVSTSDTWLLCLQQQPCQFEGGTTYGGLITHNDEWAYRKMLKVHQFHQGRQQNCPLVFLLLEVELFHLSHDLFYRSAAESILTCSISSWFDNSTAVQRDNLNKIMRTAEEIIGVLLPHLQDIYQNSAAQSQQHPQGPQTLLLSDCQSAQNKLKYLSLLIFNCSICLNSFLNYLLVYCCFYLVGSEHSSLYVLLMLICMLSGSSTHITYNANIAAYLLIN